MRAAAMVGVPPAFAKFWATRIVATRATECFRPRLAKRSRRIHIADVKASQPTSTVNRSSVAAVNLRLRDPSCTYRCSRRRTDRRPPHLPPGGRPFTDKQIDCCKTSPPRRSSPSRTRGCSTAAQIAAAADRDRRRARGHQPISVRLADGVRHAGRSGGAPVRGERRSSSFVRANSPRRSYARLPNSENFLGSIPIRAGRGRSLGDRA